MRKQVIRESFMRNCLLVRTLTVQPRRPRRCEAPWPCSRGSALHLRSPPRQVQQTRHRLLVGGSRTHSASARRKTTVCTIRRCPRHTGVPRCQVPRVYRAQVPGWYRTASSRAYSFRRKAAISGSVASKCLREDDIRHSYGDGTDAMALQHTAGMRRVEAVPWCTVDEPLRFRSVSDGRVPCHPRHAQQCRKGV